LKVAIIVFPGSNCDHDVYHVFRKILKQDTRFVWHKDLALDEYEIIVLPGGFSYGDYLRCGAIARFSPIMKEVIRQADRGIRVIGICNGFQILTESGLLPGALLKNDHQKFVCKTVYLKVENNRTAFTHLCTPGEVLRIPVAHGDGNYYCDNETLENLQEAGQIVFRYADKEGGITPDANPNGSLNNIAGIINKEGNILGMMPHPERRSDEILGHSEGRKILQSMIEKFTGN
jgi:phosphoribosylformylglycinamidine synthase I